MDNVAGRFGSRGSRVQISPSRLVETRINKPNTRELDGPDVRPLAFGCVCFVSTILERVRVVPPHDVRRVPHQLRDLDGAIPPLLDQATRERMPQLVRRHTLDASAPDSGPPDAAPPRPRVEVPAAAVRKE